MKTDKPPNVQNTTAPLPLELEQHFTIAEIAAAWNLSPNTVRRYFDKLPGVIHIGRSDNTRKRRYVTLRIPASLLHTEHSRMTRRAACR